MTNSQHQPTHSRRHFLASTVGLCAAGMMPSVLHAAPEVGGDTRPVSSALPKYRIEADGFMAAERDIRAVLDSAARQLWKHFPKYAIEPFVVTQASDGPIVLYRRNANREIVMKLNTSQTLWCQYAYQFSHEFCHILSGYREPGKANKWFEETLCELASLYSMRRMSEEWEQSPPYPHWADYRHAITEYAQNQIDEYRRIESSELPEFYRSTADKLRSNAVDRKLNGAMAVVLLPEFEKTPAMWESIRWINTTEVAEDESFEDFFGRWLKACPEKHRKSVNQIAKLYGVTPSE